MNLSRFSFSYGLSLNPARDWNMLITLVLAALLVVIGWNVWLFRQVAAGEAIGSQEPSAIAPLDQSTLDSLEEIFARRAAERAKYESGEYRFIDPSK